VRVAALDMVHKLPRGMFEEAADRVLELVYDEAQPVADAALKAYKRFSPQKRSASVDVVVAKMISANKASGQAQWDMQNRAAKALDTIPALTVVREFPKLIEVLNSPSIRDRTVGQWTKRLCLYRQSGSAPTLSTEQIELAVKGLKHQSRMTVRMAHALLQLASAAALKPHAAAIVEMASLASESDDYGGVNYQSKTHSRLLLRRLPGHLYVNEGIAALQRSRLPSEVVLSLGAVEPSELSKATERIAELHAAGQAEEDQFKSECSMYLLASIAGASPTAAQRKTILDYLKSMTDDGGSYSLDNGSMSFAAIAAMMRSLHGLERFRLAFLGGIIPKIVSMITNYPEYIFCGDDEQEWREQALSLCVSLLAKIAGVRTNVTLKPPSAA